MIESPAWVLAVDAGKLWRVSDLNSWDNQHPLENSLPRFFWHEPLPALRTHHLVKGNAADLGGRDRAAAPRAGGVDGCHHFFEIDFLLPGHSEFSHARSVKAKKLNAEFAVTWAVH